jgi:hypothetical protein
MCGCALAHSQARSFPVMTPQQLASLDPQQMRQALLSLIY